MSQTNMKILVIGNSQGTTPDDAREEIEMSNELNRMGHTSVFFDEEDFENWNTDIYNFDFVLVAKNRFIGSKEIEHIKGMTGDVPVIYWMPDYMQMDRKFVQAFIDPMKACDLVLVRQKTELQWFYDNKIRTHYWNFDVDCNIYHPDDDPTVAFKHGGMSPLPNPVPVCFVGNWVHDLDRMKILHEIQQKVDLHVVTLTMQEYAEGKFEGHETQYKLKNLHNPLYGKYFNRLVGITKINLSLDWINAEGYWSPRTARIMAAGGFALVRENKGMRSVFKDYVDYFSTVDEAVDKINYWLEHEEERKAFAERGRQFANQNLRPENRLSDLINIYEDIFVR